MLLVVLWAAVSVTVVDSSEEWSYVHVSQPGMQHLPVAPEKEIVWRQFMDDTRRTLRSLVPLNLPGDSKVGALIIEPRSGVEVLRTFEYAVRNVMLFLGEGWGLQIFCSKSNEAAVRRQLNGISGYVISHIEEVTYVGPRWDYTPNSAWLQYFMVSEGFWNAVRAEKVLVFQPDTLLCRPAHGMRDFLQYDYVGAPWTMGALATSDNGRGGFAGNGGLSLRNVTFMKRCARSPFVRERLQSRHSAKKYLSNEDMVLGMCLLSDPQAVLPSKEVAMTFSVETVFYPTPLGFHAIWRHLEVEQIRQLFATIRYDKEGKASHSPSDEL